MIFDAMCNDQTKGLHPVGTQTLKWKNETEDKGAYSKNESAYIDLHVKMLIFSSEIITIIYKISPVVSKASFHIQNCGDWG